MWILQLKSSLRYLLRQKAYTAILIFGLAIGFAASFLILLWVFDELSYDKFHEHAESIYMVLLDEQYEETKQTFTETPGPLAETLKSDFPEILDATRIKYTPDFLVNYQDKFLMERKILGVDPSFLDIFTFPLIAGNKENVLDEPNNIVITQSVAVKYFGDSDAIGKTLHFDPGFDFIVSGVLEDLPSNSMFDFDILVPINTFMIRYGAILDSWDVPDISATFVRLADGASPAAANHKIATLIQEHSDTDNVFLHLFPLTDIHINQGSAPVGSDSVTLKEIYAYLTIAFLILLIAVINFINLSTARFGQRLYEIGIKKVVGAGRSQLVRQFLAEALLLSISGFLLAILFAELLLPVLNSISGKNFDTVLIGNTTLWFTMCVLTLLAGVIAGAYPAGFLSQFNPVSIFKKQILLPRTQVRARRGLVVFQFTLSILFLFATILIYHQLTFLKNYNPGYNRENIIAVPLDIHWGHREDGTFYKALKTELLSSPDIVGVTQAFQSPGDIQTSAGTANWQGKADGQSALVNWLSVHYDFFKTLEIPIIEGRPFSPEFEGDMSDWDGGSYILNQSAAKLMGSDSPVGKWFENYGKRGKIIGVVKDFHMRSLRKDMTPLAIFVHPYFNHTILIKIRPENKQQTIEKIRATWIEHSHNYPFTYEFLEDRLDNVYYSESRSGQLLNCFASFALLIACLGLLGLISFSIQQKTKEIGIRKILGSSVAGVFVMLSREYSRSILIASIIALPLCYFMSDYWLNQYIHHVSYQWWMFLLPSVLCLSVAALSVSYFIYQASRANPIEALRYE